MPTRHLLDSAVAVAKVIDRDGTDIADLRRSYLRSRTGGIRRRHDLIRAEQFLVQLNLIVLKDGKMYRADKLAEVLRLSPPRAVEALALVSIQNSAPLWIHAAFSGGKFRPELIPDDQLENLLDLFANSLRLAAVLASLSGLDSTDRRSEIGEHGEECVMEACRLQLLDEGREDLANQVARVSLVSDGFGYDIDAPRLDGSSRHLEVKATTSSSKHRRLYLSRNEAEVAGQDSDWSLVMVWIQADNVGKVAGWASAGTLTEHLPSDASLHGRWQNAEIILTPSELSAGLPPII